MAYELTNKYGLQIALPDHTETFLNRKLIGLLDELKVNYKKEFNFDETGLRSIKFDAAVLDADGNPALLIECDGACHFEEKFFMSTGVRPVRCPPHLTKRSLGDARKDVIAAKRGIPLLRLSSLDKEGFRNKVIAYIWEAVDNAEKDPAEISMVKMLDKYGWNFDYVIPSDLGKKEREFLSQRFPEQFEVNNGTDEH